MTYPLPRHAQLRASISLESIKPLQTIPGVGTAIAKDLYLLGIRQVSDLKGRSPEVLFQDLCQLSGVEVDPCVLYTFRCAVYFASTTNPDPELLKWWNWKGVADFSYEIERERRAARASPSQFHSRIKQHHWKKGS